MTSIGLDGRCSKWRLVVSIPHFHFFITERLGVVEEEEDDRKNEGAEGGAEEVEEDAEEGGSDAAEAVRLF